MTQQTESKISRCYEHGGSFQEVVVYGGCDVCIKEVTNKSKSK